MDHHRHLHHRHHPQPPPRHLINSPPYLPLRPPPPFPDDPHLHRHPNHPFPPPQRHLPPPPPCIIHLPPPPPPPPSHHQHHHHHHLQQQHHHRRIDDRLNEFGSPPPPPPPPPHRLMYPPNNLSYDTHRNNNFNVDQIQHPPRFRFAELPPSNPIPASRVSPPNFGNFERFRRDIDGSPPPRFREDLNFEPRVRVSILHSDDAVEFRQLHRDRIEDYRSLGVVDRFEADLDRGRRNSGVVDRLESDFDRDRRNLAGVDRLESDFERDRRNLAAVERLESDFERDRRNLAVVERLENDFERDHRNLGVVERLEGDFDRDRRNLGVVERLEGDFDRDRRNLVGVERLEDRDHVRDCDHHERYHPEMVMREGFEMNSGTSECLRGRSVNDEMFMRGGRDDVVLEENVKKRRGSGGGGSGEVSRSPIKFRIGGMENDDDLSDRGREEMKEYDNHGPFRKNVQKKSAFLRIQPAKHHNSSRSRFDKNSSPHKSKESNAELLDRRSSEERVGSPVELDVSFKSNALVAKAITAAPSSSDAGFNADKALSDSGTRLDRSPSKVVRFKINSSISKKGEKYSKNRVRVFPIMKRLGNLNNSEVRANHSESSPSMSGNLSGGSNSNKASPKSEVLHKDHRNTDFEKVSSPPIRKKRKTIIVLSRLSSVVPSKADSELVNLDSLANHPSDGSVSSDTSVKQLEKELSCAGNIVGSTLNENAYMGKIDVKESSTKVDQVEVVGPSVSVESASKRKREKGIMDSLPDSSGSVGPAVSEGHANTEVYLLQGEQRISNLDGDVTKYVKNCSSDIFTQKDSVEDQDLSLVLVNNGSVEGSLESMAAGTGDNVENNDMCCENAEESDPVCVVSSTSNPVNVSNKVECELDLTCPVVDSVVACQTQVFSSLENARVGLSLGSLSIDVPSDNGIASLTYDEDGGTCSSKNADIVSDVQVTNDIDEQECQGSETTSNNDKHKLEREESPKIYSACAGEGSSVVNRKRKAGTERDSLDLRISDSCQESTLSIRFPIENEILPVEKPIPEVSGSPCVVDVSHGNGLTENCVKGMNSTDSIVDLDPTEYLSSCGKRRKILSTESVISDAPGSQSSEFIPLADASSGKCSAQLVVGFELPKSAIVEEDELSGANCSSCAVICSSAEDSKSDNVSKDSFLSTYAPPDTRQSSLPENVCNLKTDGNLMMVEANDEHGFIAFESACRVAANVGSGGFRCFPADHNGNADQRPLAMDMECDDNAAQNANLPSLSGCPQLCAGSIYGGMTTNSDLLNTASNMGLRDQSHLSPTVDASTTIPAIQVCSDEKLSMDDKNTNQLLTTESSSTSQANILPELQNNLKPGFSASSGVQSFTQKSVSLLSKHVKTTMPSSNFMNKPRRNVITRSEVSPSTNHRSSSLNKTQTYQAKPRTWHRANNLVASNTTVKKPSTEIAPPHRPLHGKSVNVHDTSYIRKGNSLVRNPVSGAATSGSCALGASIDRLKPHVTGQIRKRGGSLTIESTELPDGLVTGVRSVPIEMPKTPPLPCSGKTSDNDIAYSGDCTPSLPVYQSEGTDNQEVLKSSDASLDSIREPESVVNRNLEDPGVFSDGDVLSSNSKRMIYIKRKSNQLIAASKTSKFSVHSMDKIVASSSDSNYYKRRKNQLIRASSEGNIQQMLAVVEDSSKSLFQRALHVYPGRSSTKRLSNKVKSSKRSLVWKLGDSKSCGKGIDAWRSGRLLSHLLPWKRSTYWSRKLLSSRKRGVVYERSGRGFSLRRSKVISLPGTSLKWSKSMEKRSKKVEEEAAMAVAGASSKTEAKLHPLKKPVNGLKLHSGERIFRIGVFRYRMDPSRRTLQRISDEEADITAPITQKDARKTYVPKRLLIGSDEYVRIGNGNQLVRDPKRRTRILANEKVRWSLHTARMRLAKKRKFCQFFTRFGKCNKGEGKCPFIHDPSKIAVCTKFLNDLCADPGCKLTHKVIPERMPDCSFFLQGLCSNEKCPYRHVNVNPKASICESFLRGYCAEGNECRKKHSYICPEFEASGSCPQGSQCKLYHPKKAKSKKRKVQRDQKNSKGRYFGSGLSIVVDPETRPMLEKHVEPNKGSFVFEEELSDFISLNVSDDEAGESGLVSEQTLSENDDLKTTQLDDLDDFIKPLRIFNRV